MKNLNTLLIASFITCFMLLIDFNSKAQNNALVLNGAHIVMDGGTSAENINLVINQTSDQGIIRLPSGGHIHSENQENAVKWITNNEIGSYIFPFGIGGSSTNYIPFTFNKTAGNTSIVMSTWATDQQNSPKPNTTNVPAVNHMSGTADSVVYAIDRFWDIQATATADLTFAYLGTENTTVSPGNNLMAQHWNGANWDVHVGSGTPGVSSGVGTAGPYLNQTSFSPWMISTQCTPTISSESIEICQGDSVLIGGDWQTIAGAYSDTLLGADVFGCDSIVNTTLLVNLVDITTTTLAETITANASSPATYQWIDCNNENALIAGETGQSFTATANGDYAVVVTENGCSDTSACVIIHTVGFESHTIQSPISVYPNPATENVYVVMDKLEPSTQLQLVDNLGRIVYQIKPTNNTSIIDLISLPKGVYILIINTEKNTFNRKIIKQ